MRIAFFGGTFDPPHRGHLAVAEAAAVRLRLDKVLFAPVGNQPLKQELSVTSFEDRVAMTQLAVTEDARFEVSVFDAPRADGLPNYTIDTLLRLKTSLADGDQLFCLIGADSFLGLRHWYRAAELLFVCEFIVAGRPGSGLKQVRQALPKGVQATGDSESYDGFVRFELSNHSGQRSALYLLPDLREEISATEIRTALAEKSATDNLLSEPVAEYIHKHQLYLAE
jgi:nicotinate-nucleotide adenylyltransferase